jgi:hypothetical protein
MGLELRLRLTHGAPDEPDTGDWDAICKTPGPRQLFVALFHEISGGLPKQLPEQVCEDDARRVHKIWFGDESLGIEVTETESSETTAFPMFCKWETFGLPGMKVVWNYSLEFAGQLGFAAFRHGSLICNFETEADRQRFSNIWYRIIGKAALFELS